MDEVLQFDFEWLATRHKIKDMLQLNKLPDLNAVLLLIGVQELGKLTSAKTRKEEKQDLMHIAVCTLLSQDGYYEWQGLDADGWPHFELIRKFDLKGVEDQELYLKNKVIQYFQQSLF